MRVRGGTSVDIKRLGGKSLGRAAALELLFKVKVRTDAACCDRNQLTSLMENCLFEELRNIIMSRREQKKNNQTLTH